LFIVLLFGCVIPEELPNATTNKSSEVSSAPKAIESVEPPTQNQTTEIKKEQKTNKTEEEPEKEEEEKVETKSCVTPKSDMIITSDTIFCKGTYNLTNKAPNDYAILVNTSDVTLDCNGATIISATNETYVRAIAVRVNRTANQVYELKNITVKNCILDGFGVGIDVANRHKSSPYSINSLERKKHLDFAEYLHDVTIENNIIEAEYDGILTVYAKDVMIVNNTIEAEKQNCIAPQLSPGIKIKQNNLMSSSGSAIQLLGACDGAVIQDNTIESYWNAINSHDVGIQIIDNTITSLQKINNSVNGSIPYSPVGENVSTLTIGIDTDSYTCYKGTKPAKNIINGNKIVNFRRGIDVGLLNNEPLNQSFIEDYEKQNTFVNVRKDVFPTHPLQYHPGTSANCQ
jgi:hypothetical protein